MDGLARTRLRCRAYLRSGAILSIQETFVQGGFDIVTGDVERLAGRKPRALRDLLAGAFSGR